MWHIFCGWLGEERANKVDFFRNELDLILYLERSVCAYHNQQSREKGPKEADNSGTA